MKVAFFFITLAIVLIFLAQFYKWNLTKEGIAWLLHRILLVSCKQYIGKQEYQNILQQCDCGFHRPWKGACLTCIKDNMCALFHLILLPLKSMCYCNEFCKNHKVSRVEHQSLVMIKNFMHLQSWLGQHK